MSLDELCDHGVSWAEDCGACPPLGSGTRSAGESWVSLCVEHARLVAPEIVSGSYGEALRELGLVDCCAAPGCVRAAEVVAQVPPAPGR